LSDTTLPNNGAGQTCRQSIAASYQGGVVRVIQAMKGHLDEPFSLKSMAKVAYSSPYHFIRTFRRITGIPPCQYLWALRLEVATRLLTATEDSVLNVCYDVGYSSLGTFSRRFTELFGIPPGCFRTLSRATSAHQAYLEEAIQQTSGRETEIPEGQPAQIEGWIEYPEGFSGPSAIGMFSDSIPQGRPVAYCFSTAPGAFRISGAPDGCFFLFALGIPSEGSLCDTQTMLRAGGNKIIIENGKASGTANLKLRPPDSTDPPILLALPVLLQQAASSKSSAAAAGAGFAPEQLPAMRANGD